MPDVHPRLRKRLLRCTLDCGFKPPGKPRTAGLCGRAAGACDCGPLSCAFIERPSSLRKPSCKVRLFAPNPLPRISPKSYRYNAVSNHFSSHFSTSLTNAPRLLSRAKVGTHSALLKESHTAAHTPKQGCFGWGMLSLPSDCFTRFGNPAWPGFKTANFAAFGSWSVCSRRTQRACGTAMRISASLSRRRRGPAGLRDLFCFCRNCDLYAMRTCARQGRYHYPRCAPRAAETPDGRLSSRLICRFLRLGSHHWFQRRKIQFYLGTAFQRRNG